MLVVRLGGVTFGDPRGEGPAIDPGGLTGWWGRPASRADQIDRPAQHGEFELPTRLGARVITIKGKIMAPPERLQWWVEQVSAIGAEGDRERIEVDTDDGTTWTNTRVFDVRVDRESSVHYPTFLVIARAPDPRRYGEVRESVSTGGQAVAFHRGNFFARPRFLVTGNMPNGYRLEGDGHAWVVPGPVSAGQQDYVDTSTLSVTRNGVPVQGITPDAFVVPRGKRLTWRLVTSGTGRARMLTTDTFV